MQFMKIKKWKTVEEWATNNEKEYPPHRDDVKICVIDNDGFPESIRNLGYSRIILRSDYNGNENFNEYDVILCDIKDIGIEIDPNIQGIAVALDIKKLYPNKIVIQYSGINPYEFDIDFLLHNTEQLDGYIKKDQSTKAIVDQLDEICSVFWNPIKAWKFAEKNMRRNGVSNKIIAYFEDAYVRSLSKKEDYMELYMNKIKNVSTAISSLSPIIKFLSIVLKSIMG